MINAVAEVFVLVMGVAISALSLWGMFSPNRFRGFVREALEEDWGIHAAVVVRIFLGLALIIAAADSRFPILFQSIGWLALIAAVVLMLAGRVRLLGILVWIEKFSTTAVRLWMLSGLLFGGLLICGIS